MTWRRGKTMVIKGRWKTEDLDLRLRTQVSWNEIQNRWRLAHAKSLFLTDAVARRNVSRVKKTRQNTRESIMQNATRGKIKWPSVDDVIFVSFAKSVKTEDVLDQNYSFYYFFVYEWRRVKKRYEMKNLSAACRCTYYKLSCSITKNKQFFTGKYKCVVISRNQTSILLRREGKSKARIK